MGVVSGFFPSSHGFRFRNSWPRAAAFRVNVLGVDVDIGNAQRGLCGGMVFAVRDYFESGLTVPGDREAPATGPLYEYIGRRLKDSFDLPYGPAKYLDFMATRDGDLGVPWRWVKGSRWRGVAWRTIHDELPRVLADIDHGRLSCLGLVCTKGFDVMDLGMNHQVLAYRYERALDDVRLWVYDPNRPLKDDVFLSFSAARPTKPTPFAFVNGSKNVRGFFRVAYTRGEPPRT